MALDFAKGITEFRWHGRGGQGVVTSNQMLGKAALAEGNYIQAFPEFGPERTGAPVRAFLRISKDPIQIYAQVYNPDVVVCIDPTLLEVVNPVEGLKEEGTLVLNTTLSPDDVRKKYDFKTGRVVAVDATSIALDILGRPFYNMPTMAAAVHAVGTVKIDTAIEAVLERYPGKIGELNKAAMEKAVKEAQVG
ncbi:MAG: Pyruvate/ketoisovalerate oxidoreductases common subunit gamma [Candidatus Thorarchaeota archaeon]|nr:MAG: Pyruvate/ketoisovalerate oxidoreductases common subunit gamma [Candidatus Thorarchaeota archaeon]